MAISYIDPSTNEPVEKERWRWVALYNDGSTLHQFAIENNKAIFHKFADIDTTQLKQFRMEHDSLKPVVIDMPDGAKLVHAYVNAVIQTPLGDGVHVATNSYKGYKFGYQLNGSDYGVLIDYDDTIKLLHNFNKANVAEGIQ